MSNLTIWPELSKIAERTAKRFGLRLRGLRPITNQRARVYGFCTPDGWIELRVHVLNRPREPLSRAHLLKILAHELAHLKDASHGAAWKEMRQAVLNWWRDEGWI